MGTLFGMTMETYPTTGILTPTLNDVLLGRGAGINGHQGNVNFRAMVKAHQNEYLAAITNIQKYLIVMDILQAVRSLSPPGRFITQETSTGLWYDVGDEKARRKIGQALRENASSIRKTNNKKNDDTTFDVRQSLVLTDYTKDKTYCDVRNAIENEMSKKESPLRKQFCMSYESQQQTADMVFSIPL